MSWNYEEIAVDSYFDVLNAIKTFAATCLWVTDKTTLDEHYIHSLGENGSEVLFFSMKAIKYTVGGNHYSILFNCNLSFNGSNTWNNQPSTVSKTQSAAIALEATGNLSVYCFGNKDVLYFVIKTPSGYVQHISFGKLERINITDNEQQFIISSQYATVATPNIHYNTPNVNPYAYYSGGTAAYPKIIRNGSTWKTSANYLNGDYLEIFTNDFRYVNTYNNATNSPLFSTITNKHIFIPIHWFDHSTTSPLLCLGKLKNIFYTCPQNITTIGEEVVYGSMVFKLFPLHSLTIVGERPAIAIRKL